LILSLILICVLQRIQEKPLRTYSFVIFALRDGRLKQLTTFIVYVSNSSVVYNMVSLHIIKLIFSDKKNKIEPSNNYFSYYYVFFPNELLYPLELAVIK